MVSLQSLIEEPAYSASGHNRCFFIKSIYISDVRQTFVREVSGLYLQDLEKLPCWTACVVRRLPDSLLIHLWASSLSPHQEHFHVQCSSDGCQTGFGIGLLPGPLSLSSAMPR